MPKYFTTKEHSQIVTVDTQSRARFRQHRRHYRYILFICTTLKRELVSDPSLHDWALCCRDTLSIPHIIAFDLMPVIKTRCILVKEHSNILSLQKHLH